jgi:hypothetical protein
VRHSGQCVGLHRFVRARVDPFAILRVVAGHVPPGTIDGPDRRERRIHTLAASSFGL